MAKISLIEEILFFYLQLQTGPKVSFSSSIWRCVHCIKMVFRPPKSWKLWCRSWKNRYLWRQCWREFSCSRDIAGKMLSIFTYYVFFEKWKVLVAQLCLFVIPWTVARLLCPWNSPGKNTGVGCLLQGILPTQRWNPGLLHCRQILYHLSHHVLFIFHLIIFYLYIYIINIMCHYFSFRENCEE